MLQSKKTYKYESLLKSFPEKADEIQKWIDSEKSVIKKIQEEIHGSLQYKYAVTGKYFIATSEAGPVDDPYIVGIMLVNVTNYYFETTSIFHKYDALGEITSLMFNEDGECIHINYYKDTNKTPALSSNDIYCGNTSWAEISRELYDAIKSEIKIGLQLKDVPFLNVICNLPKFEICD